MFYLFKDSLKITKIVFKVSLKQAFKINFKSFLFSLNIITYLKFGGKSMVREFKLVNEKGQEYSLMDIYNHCLLTDPSRARIFLYNRI